MIKISKYILFILISGCTLISEPETAENYRPEKVLDETISIIKTNYPFIPFKRINTDSLYSYYSSNISLYNGDEIFKLLYDILYELKDGHVWFFNSSRYQIQPYIPPRSIKDNFSFSLNVVKEYFKGNFNIIENGRIVYGIINNTIGYIFIRTFSPDNFNYKIFSDVITNLKNTKGIIVDVRSNGGGSDLVAHFIFSHFINEPFLSPIWLDSGGNELSRKYIQPVQNYYSNPVILLQNGTCFSATEGFICMMRELDNVSTLGDTTAGGSGAPKDFQVSYNIKIHLSTFAQLTYQREFIEWNGIKPDILLQQSKRELENVRDMQLEEAIHLLNKE